MPTRPKYLKGLNTPFPRIQKYERYLPTAFDDSLSMLEKINKVIQFLYEYSDVTEQMLDKWNEVYHWILNDGLEELVRYRLDEFIEDGTIERIINEEIFGELNDKVDSVIKDLESIRDELVDEVNDLIEQVQTELTQFKDSINQDFDDFKDDVELQIKDKLDMFGYYDEIEVETYRDIPSRTHYHIAKIPKTDKDGNPIKIKVTDDRDVNGLETVRELAKKKQASIAINVTPTSANNGNLSTIINDGDVRRTDTNRSQYNEVIGIHDNGEMKSFPYNTSTQSLINQGYNTAIPAFIGLIENGRDITTNTSLSWVGNFTESHPRSIIAQDYQLNTYLFVCEGRLTGQYGMYTKDVIRVLLSHNMKWAHMLDGGGSSQLVHYHHNVNRVSGARSGDNGSTERPIHNIIYAGKDEVNKTATEVLSSVGDATMRTFRITQYLDEQRYTRANWVELEDYLINGWRNQGTSGANKVRGWVMPNNTLYLVGVITGGEISKPFMQLPEDIRPNFTTHHLVPGNKENEIYKIIVRSNGECQWYYWNTDGRPTGGSSDFNFYIKLDGIFVPLNPSDAGIQNAWNREIDV